jgi:predicted aspartyl protease
MLTAVAVLMWAPAFAYGQSTKQHSTAELDLRLRQQRYVELERILVTNSSELPPFNRAFFEGVMANRTNQVQRSIQLLESPLPTLIVSNPYEAEVALCSLADDYAKSFRYSDASSSYAEASRLAKQQGKSSECDAGREASRWALLNGAPAQTVTGTRAFTVRGKRDSLGLFQVQVTTRNYVGSWIVDSGASLSVISRSAADRMGLELSANAGTAEGTAGLSIPVRTAVIPEMRLGEAVVRNAAVLVAEDSDLSFPKIGYQVEGSLGLPVLAALGRVTFYPDGRVSFSRKKETGKRMVSHNLFFEKFAPLVTADFGHGTQLFALDTGAVLTVLSAQFYRENRGVLDIGEWTTLELQGAGGAIVSPAYVLRSVVAKLGGGCAKVENLPLLTEPTGLPDEFYGNLGESALTSFSSFTLDFNVMHFSVSGGDCSAGG